MSMGALFSVPTVMLAIVVLLDRDGMRTIVLGDDPQRRERSFSCQVHLEHDPRRHRSEEHTSELQSLMRISYAVFCLKKKNKKQIHDTVKTLSKPIKKSTK